MSLAQQIVTGFGSATTASAAIQALNLIKSFLSNPSISEDLSGGTGYPVINPAVSVPIQGSDYHEIGDDDVSTQLIVDSSGGKNYITDNIAPRPRVWEVKGFIGASIIEQLAGPILQDIQQKRLRDLRAMRSSRKMLVWRTKNGEELLYVGIKHLQVDSDPMIQNRIPITMTIQEIPILAFGANNQLGIPLGNSPSGDPLPQGLTSAILATQLLTEFVTAAGI